MKNSLQLKISLAKIKPLIWRRVRINADLSLEEMSEVINTVMPWHGGHLHQFIIKDKCLVMPFPDSEDESIEEYKDTKIGDLLSKESDFIKYEYDFGDNWIHNISVEKVLPEMKERRAEFIKGKNMAPPEDCGGVEGYERLKEIMSDSNHPEYQQMAEWLGMDEDEEFDPSYIGCDDEDIDDLLFDTLE